MLLQKRRKFNRHYQILIGVSEVRPSNEMVIFYLIFFQLFKGFASGTHIIYNRRQPRSGFGICQAICD
jgi:hypothetical protein